MLELHSSNRKGGEPHPVHQKGGYRMQRILNFGCGAIAYNAQYIAAGGNKIGLVNRISNEMCGTLAGKKNITALRMNDGYVYAKTTAGIYSMFDLETQQLQGTGYCREKKNSSHDGKFYVATKGILLDILSFKDGQYYFMQYDFISQKYEKVCVAKSNFTCKDWLVDDQERKAYILFLEKCCLNHSKTNCYISVVAIDTLQIQAEKSIAFEHGVVPIGLINTHSVLLNTMQIYDMDTSEKTALDSNTDFQNTDYGYFVRMRLAENSHLILIFSKRVLVFDLTTNKLCQSCAYQYGHDAIYLDGKTYIATWDGFFLADE